MPSFFCNLPLIPTMFPLFLKNLSFLPSCPSSSSSSQLPKLFTRFQVCEFTSYSFPAPPPLPPPPQPPEVSVWWDLDSCPVPPEVSFRKVAPSIIAAVRANGIMGTIHIRAYGDVNSSKVDKEALNSTNISLYSITDSSFIKQKINRVGKNNTYKHFLMDLNDWVSTNPPPVHLFLIFGNGDFSGNGILHRLRMCNYNILLACPGRAHFALCHAATIMWEWSSMLKGEDLTGKHFNYPPDGPFNSWYGNSNVLLENPFSVAEVHTFSQNAEIYKPSLDIKSGEASKSVSRQLMKILCSHPNGISMGDLRAELTKCDLPLGKRFYGHKFFSNFLVSIPHVQLEYLGEGNFWVRLVPSTTSALNNKQKDSAATQKLHNEGKNMDRIADGIPRISSSCVSREGDDLKAFQSIPSQGKPIGEYVDGKSSFPSFMESNAHQPPDELQKTSREVDVARALLPQIQLPPNDNISNKSDNDIVKSDDVSPVILEKIDPLQNPSTCNDCNVLKNNDIANLESGKVENKHEIPTRKEVDEVCRSPFTSTFFSWISSWWTFWKSNSRSDDLIAHQDVIYSRKLELFEDSKLSEVDQIAQIASHFEEPKSSELQQDLSHPPQPHWDNFRVSVWWDFDSCGVPSDISFLNVAPSIMGVLRANGIKGPIHIDAYGDVSQLSEIKQEALFLSGIDLHHIPGGKNKNKCFMDWLSQNPPPRHLFLISGDKNFDFSGTVHRTWLRRTDNILLACPGKAHGYYVCKAATIVWQWSSVLKGKYLTGKYFKHPPRWYTKVRVQVPLEYPPEWYRNSKVPHENPFSATEEPASSQNAEIHEPSSYIKLVEVQKLVSRQVRKVLSSYPNGISIGDLHLQLRMAFVAEVSCGCKEFSNILASIPHVQLLYIGDDNFCVRLIPSTTSNVKKQWAIKNEQRDVNHLGMPVLFSTGSFWDDVESFVFTSRGSRLLSRSRSREDLAQRLQMHGPLFMSLTENKILQLVELLIAEKKWLEESPSQAFPFRLTKSVQKS